MTFKRFAAALTLALGSVAAAPAMAANSTSSAVSSTAISEMSLGLVEAGLNPAVLDAALADYAAHQDVVKNQRYIGIIDYTVHSSRPRFFVYDLDTGTAEVLLVAHGSGSDPRHEGRPSAFSNTMGSRMTSVGSYVTAETYYGRHGLSLRLDGLSDSNSAARERLIVIHGADYVSANRGTQGRSWGCPAVERAVADDLIEKFKGGAFLYVHGAGEETNQA